MTTSTAQRLPPSDLSEPGWRRAFHTLSREHGYEPLRVEGPVPEDLRGTLLRVGPWSFELHGQRFRHWFDGDGGVMGVRFEQGGVRGAARLIETASIQAERKGRGPRRSRYATVPPMPFRLGGGRQLNLANTSVMAWNGRVYSLFEGTGLATELSAEDLGTLGETDFEGVVVSTFSAHPHRVPSRRAAYNFGVRYARHMYLDVYELPDAGPVRRLTTVPLAGMTMLHDWIVTERHLVVFAPPLRLRAFRVLLGMGSYADNLEWRPREGTEVLVIPIDRPDEVARLTVDPFFQWHFVNAYEQGEQLVVDYVRYPDFSSNLSLGELLHGVPKRDAQGELHRATVDPKAGTFRSERVNGRACDFPRVAPRVASVKHRYAYLAGFSGPRALRGPPDALVKVDMETGRETLCVTGPEQYPSEPVFVPRPGGSAEDDGYVLTLVYDARTDTSHVAVLDARALDAPPRARAHFDHALPLTFHGDFVPARGGA